MKGNNTVSYMLLKLSKSHPPPAPCFSVPAYANLNANVEPSRRFRFKV